MGNCNTIARGYIKREADIWYQTTGETVKIDILPYHDIKSQDCSVAWILGKKTTYKKADIFYKFTK